MQANSSLGRRPVIAWHPDGSLLAVPGAYGEVDLLPDWPHTLNMLITSWIC